MPSLVVAAVQSRANGEGRCFLRVQTLTKMELSYDMERRPCATILLSIFFFLKGLFQKPRGK